MAKITAEGLAMADQWNKFGDRFGWKLVSCSEDSAVFTLKSGTRWNVPMEARTDISMSLREGAPGNIAKIGGAG